MRNVRPRVHGEFARQMKEYVARLTHDIEASTPRGTVTLPAGTDHFFVKLPKDGSATIEIVAPGTPIDGWLAEMTDAEYQAISATLIGTQKGDWPELRQSPGPPKQFPHRLELRYDDAVRQAIEALRAKTGEDASSLIRRLIREDHARISE